MNTCEQHASYFRIFEQIDNNNPYALSKHKSTFAKKMHRIFERIDNNNPYTLSKHRSACANKMVQMDRYARVEGEALAVVWGLEQTQFFTQSCDNLVVVTDHTPLVEIFGDRTPDEITNTRLFRLKQRTLMRRFKLLIFLA